MVVYDSQTILLSVIGMIGLLSTAVILGTAFGRNRLAKGNYQ